MKIAKTIPSIIKSKASDVLGQDADNQQSTDVDFRNFKWDNLDPTKKESHRILRDLVLRNGVWFRPDILKALSHLAPFAIRDPSCRKSYNKLYELWAIPRFDGYLSDDNSLIKNWVKGVPVLYQGSGIDLKGLQSGFTACHLWRGKLGDVALNMHPHIYSCVANLIWLPTGISRLTDQDDSYVQTLIQAISLHLFGQFRGVNQQIDRFFRDMDLERTRRNMEKFEIGKLENLIPNYFLPSGEKFQRHHAKIQLFLDAALANSDISELRPRRYFGNLPTINWQLRINFFDFLTQHRLMTE